MCLMKKASKRPYEGYKNEKDSRRIQAIRNLFYPPKRATRRQVASQHPAKSLCVKY